MDDQLSLGQGVKIICSGEAGTIEAIAEYLNGETQIYVHYKAADGRAVESWWGVSKLELII